MPVHRVKKHGSDPALDLRLEVERLDRVGEAVVQVIEHDREWLVLTSAQAADGWETRG